MLIVIKQIDVDTICSIVVRFQSWLLARVKNCVSNMQTLQARRVCKHSSTILDDANGTIAQQLDVIKEPIGKRV